MAMTMESMYANGDNLTEFPWREDALFDQLAAPSFDTGHMMAGPAPHDAAHASGGDYLFHNVGTSAQAHSHHPYAPVRPLGAMQQQQQLQQPQSHLQRVVPMPLITSDETDVHFGQKDILLDSLDDDNASEPVSPFLGPIYNNFHSSTHPKWPDVSRDAPTAIKSDAHMAAIKPEAHMVTSAEIAFLDDGAWGPDVLLGDLGASASAGTAAVESNITSANIRQTAPGVEPANSSTTTSDADDTPRHSSRPRRAAAMKPRRNMRQLLVDSEGEGMDDDDDEDYDVRRRNSPAAAASRKRVRSKRANSTKKRRRSCNSDWSVSSQGIAASSYDNTSSSASNADRQTEIAQFLERVQRSGSNATDAAAGLTDEQDSYMDSASAVSGAATEKAQYKCPHPNCPHTFSWKWAMEDHAASHMPEKGRVHKCTYCSKSFFTVGCLKSHVRIHTRKPNSYVCKAPGCTKTYSTSEGLRLHTRNIHEADKKWKCPSDGCSKSFVRQSDLRLHIIRIHSKDRPYPCTMKNCEKSFACYSELKRHLTSHKDAHGLDAACAKAEASHRAIVAARR
ncbi:Zinc finger protein 143 [Hondaea fermentalgiana]|uniref:Zinc finger protein 143 n=1 Tax=Hondaea fermentalgiana TaxID=2315210 RepID=A0A2R5GM33_9STRA|nr:Zinc finger protein 143 [Hondaea fermentalgiana]|eukprot:GBG31685.1 Zinc finger protein 143 [Hondaea fermentalgiana]